MTSRRWIVAGIVFGLLGIAEIRGQTVTGVAFEDVDRDGVWDPGEPVLPGVAVDLFGSAGGQDLSTSTNALGLFSFAPASVAKYCVDLHVAPDYRGSLKDIGADPHPIPNFPVGRLRMGDLEFMVPSLRSATGPAPFLHVGIGDSIAFGFNACDSLFGNNGYLEDLTDLIDATTASAVLSKIAVPGYETSDLLDPGANGNIFDAILASPDLVTVSIGGNDYLADDGNEALTALNLVNARQNLQEILSTLLTEIPSADVVLNTVYDNEDGNDAFHNRWAPIWNQMLRDVASGQNRPVAIAEIWPEFNHADPATGVKLGHQGLICHDLFGADGIHPTSQGYRVHREKNWQAMGGATVGSSGNTHGQFGYLHHIGRRTPTTFVDVQGGASNESNAFVEDGVAATIPAGNQELILAGFDARPAGLLTQAVVNVRYRTTAPPNDDRYRMQASVDGTFSAPGSTSSTWNTILPIVGSAGNAGAVINAFPHQPTYRTVSTTLSVGSPIDGQPSITWQDLATLAVRLKGTAAGGADAFSVQWDAAWVDLYGVEPHRLLIRGDGSLGSTVRMDTTGEQGSFVMMFYALAPGSVPFHPWGTLGLDPVSLRVLLTGSVGGSGSLTLQAPVPNDPGLPGITVYFQSLVVDDLPARLGALTNVVPLTFQ